VAFFFFFVIYLHQRLSPASSSYMIGHAEPQKLGNSQIDENNWGLQR